MSDVIGDAFAKRRIKGLHGLSFASYEMGWLDSINQPRTDPRDELIKKLVGALRACEDYVHCDNPEWTSIEQALAEAKQLGYGE